MFFNKDKVIDRLTQSLDEIEQDNSILSKQNEILSNTISIISGIISSKTTPNSQKVLETNRIISENLMDEELFYLYPSEDEPPETV